MVPAVGIEPTWIAPHDFESCAYTSSATRAQNDSEYLQTPLTSACQQPDYYSPSVVFGQLFAMIRV